ncbi:MAG: hypothetical protein HWD61_13180 [Parachlamydiaceae bacterium]|nr:MAG: hypothetical protein HWD61_13180 [Parachlamydiaceae bacterium]
MNELKDPNDWVGFFQLACENENWRATKPVLMDRVVEKIEKIAHEGQLPLASVRQICELAKNIFRITH